MGGRCPADDHRGVFGPAFLYRRVGVGAAAAVLVVVTLAAPAHAATTAIAATLTAANGAVTVDLGGSVYDVAPSWVRISASRNRCTTASPCWAAPDATTYLSTDFTGRVTLTGLHPNAQYQVRVATDETGMGFAGIVAIPKAVNAAPSDPPLASVSADGLKAVVTVQPETNPESLNDATPIAKLRYSVDAYVGGKLLKRVLTKVAPGVAHTISGLPRTTAITFAVVEVNSVGESPPTVTPGGILLSPTAPGPFLATWQTKATSGAIRWNAPAPGAGTIAKYLVAVQRGTKTVFAKTVAGPVRQVTIARLAARSSFTATVTAVNSYGTSTTIGGTLITP